MKDKKIQYKILANIAPSKRLLIALDLIYSAKELKRASLRQKYRDESDKDIERRLKELFLYATT